MSLAGVTEAYRIGGIPAIAAMAYGTETIQSVNKVFGPGNAYVVEAKRQAFGSIGVDLLPGPSEVMVIADGQANARFVAADLLAQAEHGSGREKIYLVSLSKEMTKRVKNRLSDYLGKDYEFGDITRQIENQRREWVKSYLGEEAAENYRFGDITKKALADFVGKDEYQVSSFCLFDG